MHKAKIAGAVLAAVVTLIVAAFVGIQVFTPDETAVDLSPEGRGTAGAAPDSRGFLYGRVTTITGESFEGRMRFGGTQEAVWNDFFNGVKTDNPWATPAVLAHVPRESRDFEVFGIRVTRKAKPLSLHLPFAARLGDIERVDAEGKDVRVTLKSGTVVTLDRMEAGDFDDGLRVWDASGAARVFESLRIRSIELLPTPADLDAPPRLHGTVRTTQGTFTGFVSWNRDNALGTDELVGRTPDGQLGSLRFDTIRSIERRSAESARVTLVDGREIELSGTTEVGPGNRGIAVDDPRLGRVSVSWEAFERVDFTPGGSGPGYGDFPPGRPLTGTVVTRDGRRLTGRLVHGLDENETVEILDAEMGSLLYSIPFGAVASVVPRGTDEYAAVTLHDGEVLRVERSGDLSDETLGMLVFGDGPGKGENEPDLVPWAEVARVDYDP